MNKEHIAAYAAIPQPPMEKRLFVNDLKSRFKRHFTTAGCDAGATAGCLGNGYTLANPPETVATAVESLRRAFADKGVPKAAEGYRIAFANDASLEPEAYIVKIAPEGTTLSAADDDGMRRAIYFLEDRLSEAEKDSATCGEWRRKSFVKHRISRCFFGPTYRGPFYIDELTNDIDYYPDEYLNKLAHEGVNGLWLSMYFKDLPSSLYPGHGKDAEKRFEKLRLTIERCQRYGIRIYIYFCEPKIFGEHRFQLDDDDMKRHPDAVGTGSDKFHFFCTSSATGKKYLDECVSVLFGNAPKLGGIINIIFGEDIGSCVANTVSDAPQSKCPVCSRRDPADIYHDDAAIFAKAMHRCNPDAEYIGWFYAPEQRDGYPLSQRLLQIADKWPADCCMMFNCESGATLTQLGKPRTVFDYSLAFVKSSELFRQAAKKVKKPAAKLQVGCSHEDASVPFIPVPGNLYEKYQVMHELGVHAAMQCWYFGNYPGLMNRAAGELSFAPFPENEDEFLVALAKPDWRRNAEKAVQAWKYFADGYRKFPINLAFEWYGPLHHSIVWPLHLFPVDEPIAPSWILKHFPEVSGDRIGESIHFAHTLDEVVELVRGMCELWEKGLAILMELRGEYADDPARLADIGLAQAIWLQMQSTYNVLRFYSLRYDLFYNQADRLEEMKKLVFAEIANSEEMITLCEKDLRLGYHSEAEGYLFFPEKLRARIGLLQELLHEDFPKFRIDDPVIDVFTGQTPTGPQAVCGRDPAMAPVYAIGNSGAEWKTWHDAKNLYIQFDKTKEKRFLIEIEPVRCWAAAWINIAPDEPLYITIEHRVPPEIWVEKDSCGILLVTVPLSMFDGIRREGYPMRMNIRCGADEYWVPGEKWPSRLLQQNWTPALAGWLILE